MERVFISYSHNDAGFVDRIVAVLSDRFSIWMDRLKSQPGVPLLEQIVASIDTSTHLLAVLSKTSVRSRWVRKELAIADARGVRILPLRIDQCEVPPEVSHLPYIDFVGLGYANGVAAVYRMLESEVVVAGRIKLARLHPWGGIKVEHPDDFTAVIHSPEGNRGGLVYHDPLFLAGYKLIKVTIRRTDRCSFTGYSRFFPKMLKVEMDGAPVLENDRAKRVRDDSTYVKPRNGPFTYYIPTTIVERGALHKLELIFGKGTMQGLEVAARLEVGDAVIPRGCGRYSVDRSIF